MKYGVLYILGRLGFGMNSLIFSIITGIVVTTMMVFFIVVKEIIKKN